MQQALFQMCQDLVAITLWRKTFREVCFSGIDFRYFTPCIIFLTGVTHYIACAERGYNHESIHFHELCLWHIWLNINIVCRLFWFSNTKYNIAEYIVTHQTRLRDTTSPEKKHGQLLTCLNRMESVRLAEKSRLLVSKNIEWHVPRLRWRRIPTDFWESRRVAGHRAWEIRTVGGHRFNTVLTLQALKAGFFLFGLSCFVLPFFSKLKVLNLRRAARMF